MAHHKSALKRIRQTKRRNEYNRDKKKGIKVAVKAVREAQSYEEGLENLKKLYKVLDKASVKGIVHKNTAARKKSRLVKYVKSLKSE
jgi:small subunit ribosomal protein S20